MPAHALLGSIAVVVSALAALSALAYAFVLPIRRALRWPTVLAAVAALTLVVMAGEAGKTLLEAVEATGSPAEVTAAQAHAHGSDPLLASLFFLLISLVSTVWTAMRPSRDHWTGPMRVAAAVTATTAASTLVFAGAVLYQALHAVAVGHPSWGV